MKVSQRMSLLSTGIRGGICNNDESDHISRYLIYQLGGKEKEKNYVWNDLSQALDSETENAQMHQCLWVLW